MRRIGSSSWFIPAVVLCLIGLSGCSSLFSEPETLGPFTAGEVARVGDLSLELITVMRGAPDWRARGERESVNATSVTLAGEGKHYVDVFVRIEDLTLDPDPNAQLPSHDDPYVIADGERIPVGDLGVESYGNEAPANRLVSEFAIPLDARDVVMFLPLETDPRTIVSFRLR
ncbi:MAG: hypothetical protein Q8K89_00810 [Actinomycetota bacterium]|nr:hypothetical protein [Actinomycetota bacterium]